MSESDGGGTGIECAKCEQEATHEDGFECDGCMYYYHLACGDVLKREAKARAASSRLQIYCKECVEKNPSVVSAVHVKSILKYVEKIDLVLQQQKISNEEMRRAVNDNSSEIKLMKDYMAVMHGEMRERNAKSTDSVANHVQPTGSYANVLKNKGTGILRSVVIQPKNHKQRCEATLQKIKESIGDIERCVRDTKHTRNGGIVISCASAGDTVRMKQQIDTVMSDEYEVRLPQIKNPRVKISQINIDLETDDILHDIMNKNDLLNSAKMEIKKTIRHNHIGTQDIIAELDCVSFDTMMTRKKLLIGWKSCSVYEHVYIKRCFKCCGFSHIAKDCKHDLACSKCAGSHKSNACDSRILKCINCSAANAKFGLNLTTEHHAWSRDCTVLHKRTNKLREIVQYNPAE